MPDGSIQARDIMYLSLSFDHRLVDGAEAASFTREVIRLLETPTSSFWKCRMEAMKTYDLIVMGTGPGGYHAAIRGAQLGLKVLAVEAAEVGGVCLNVGCIPTKALLHAAETLHHLKVAEGFGLKAKPELDFKKLGTWRDGVVRKLTGGVAGVT